MAVPSTIDVTDFSFRQLLKLKISEFADFNEESCNLLAASSRFGLIFVACRNGLKVIRLETVLDLDIPQKRAKEEASDFLCQTVSLTSSPSVIALSCDSLTLAVCISKGSLPFSQLFDVRTFATQNAVPVPFNEICLSSTPNVRVRDITWNPLIAEVFAFCASDGSLGIYEVSGTNFKIMANLPPSSASTALCWSPKGKQLVVGKADGKLVQYKPNLQETKVIPSPTVFENPMMVKSVHWLSTTQFAAVYAISGCEDRTPHLVIVNLPKNEPPSYLNYGDVCFGIGERFPHYFMHHQAEWHILLCTSANALETAVLGSQDAKQPLWQQWNLDDRGRAELPLHNGNETSAFGMAVIYSSQRRIIISDNESYPPMPILLLLSSNGILCPFHMLNTRQSVPNLVNPAEAIPIEGERKGVFAAPLQTSFVTSTPASLPVADPSLSLPTPACKMNLLPKFSETVQKPVSSASTVPSVSIFSGSGNPLENFTTGIQASTQQPFKFSVPSTAAFTQPVGSTTPLSVMPVQQQPQGAGNVGSRKVIASSQPVLPKPRPQQVVVPVAVTPVQPKQISVAKTGQEDSSISARPILVPIAPSKVAAVSKEEEKKSVTVDTYTLTMIEEMSEFEKEIKDLKSSVARNCFLVGAKEEMGQLRKTTEVVQDFSKDIKDTMQSLASDIHMLKSSLLESFALLEEAKSREARDRDPHYLSLQRSYPLDPISARRLREIRRLYHYLDCQLREVDNRLDHDWKEYTQFKKKNEKLKNQYPSMQVLYKTLLNNHNLLGSLREELDRLTSHTKDLKLRGTPGRRVFFEAPSLRGEKDDLSTLADTLLETRLSPKDASPRQSSTTKLTPVKESALRDFLSQRQIRTVKAKHIGSLSESRIVSIFRLSQSERKQVQKFGEISTNVEISSHESNSVTTSAIKPAASLIQTNLPNALATAVSQGVTTTVESVSASAKVSPSTVSDQNKPVSKFIFQPSTAGALPPNVSIFSKPVPISSSLPGFSFSLTPSVAANKGVPLTGGSSAQAQSSSPPLPTSTSAFGGFSKISSTPSIFSFNSSSDQSSAKKTNTDGTVKSVPFAFTVLTPPAKHQSSPEAPKAPSAKVALVLQGSGTSAFASPKPSVSPPRSRDVDVEQEKGLPKYDSITPPDSPQPILVYEEVESPADITEETKIIEVDVGASLGRSSPPAIKVSSTGPSFAFKTPTTTPSFSFPPADGVKQPLFSVAQKSNEPSFTSPTSTVDNTSASTNTASDTLIPKPSISAPFPAFTFASSTAFKSAKPTSSDFSFAGTLALQSKATPTEQSVIPPVPSETKILVVDANKTTGTETLSVEKVTSPLPVVPLPASTSVATVSASVPSLEPKTSVTSAALISESPSIPSQSPSSDVPVTAASILSTFGQTQPVAASFGQLPVSPVFEQPASTSPPTSITITVPPVSSVPVFGQGTSTTTASIFGQTSPATSTSQTFGQSTVVPVFGQSTAAPVFGVTTSPSAGTVPLFGQGSIATTSVTPSFGQTTPVTSAPLFGNSTSVFGSPAASSPQPAFGSTGAAAVFAQASTLFGKQETPSSTAPIFGQSSPLFGQATSFGQTPASGASIFGQSPSVFGQSPTSSSLFSGQQTANSGNSVFGQPATSSAGFSFAQQAGVFGQNQNLSFGQQTGSTFGSQQSGPSSILGQNSSFFGGLGAKPNPDNVAKNVFGSATSFGSPQSHGTSLFGNQGANSFGNQFGSFTGGSFSSGSGGSVAQSGFGAFQQSPQKTGAFGAAPVFGSTFGSSPSFGGSATFGSGNVPTFGSTFGAPSNSPGFGTFGSAVQQPSTFGSLANQNQTPAFGSLSPQPAAGFGGLNQQQSPQVGFGTPPSFGTGSAFGQGSFGSQSSAFSQWRQ